MKSIETILDIGAMFYRVDRNTLIGRRRDEQTTVVRNSIISACRDEGHTFHAIGREFNRNHGTASWAVRRLTVQRLGSVKWERHLAFLDVLKSSDEESTPVGLVDDMVSQIDAKIRALQKVREAITGVRQQVSDAETPTHWQEK